VIVINHKIVWPVQQPKEPVDGEEDGENVDGEAPPTLAEMKKVSILRILQNIFSHKCT
jgi:hypothetical protein